MSYQGWSDFRSDTVTRPTAEMRQAMAAAEVDDDVLGHDPTTQRLEELAASTVGKEAALFVPSGTMGNTLALLAHGCRGREVVLEEKCHIFLYEAGNIGNIVGAVPRPVSSERGSMPLDAVAENIKDPGNMHVAPTAGICLENTHNYHGGAVMPIDHMAAIHDLAKKKNLFLHLDGARIFNAAASLGIEARAIAAHCDTVMFCLSKGLASPVGSILAGPAPFIREAHRIRKQLGGAMRQSGILAAAGIISLTRMAGRLVEDHRRARKLAEGVSTVPGLSIDPETVESNIVIFSITRPALSMEDLCRALKEEKVLSAPFGPGRIRMVTHNDIDDADVEKAVAALARVLKRKLSPR